MQSSLDNYLLPLKSHKNLVSTGTILSVCELAYGRHTQSLPKTFSWRIWNVDHVNLRLWDVC